MQVKLSKVLPVTQEAAFDMWLNPASIRRWMCPGDTHVALIELDPVEGGTFRIDMQTPSHAVYMHTGRYITIQRADLLVFTWLSSAVDHQETLVTITFHVHPDGCLMELVHERLPHQRSVENQQRGWADILEKMVGNS